MKILHGLRPVVLISLLALNSPLAIAQVASTTAAPVTSTAQQMLAKAASEDCYTYLVFYREDSLATRAMAQVIKETLAKRPGSALSAYVQITRPSEKILVDRYGVARAPMPLTVAVAPNGAMTGLFPGKVTDQQLVGAMVTRSKAGCMKAIQANKLVFLCVQSTSNESAPQAVQDFQVDPQFKDRTAVVFLPAADASEAAFLKELKIDLQQPGAATTAFMAPPGVLVGKFSSSATKDEMAAALHKAGKCCDDPNCKHNHAAPTKK